MKIVKTKWFPFGGYKAINLFGILFTKSDLSETEINHEAIHTAQMKEQHDHYHEVSFEEEANYYESNLAYLRWRKHYEWFKYIGLHSNE